MCVCVCVSVCVSVYVLPMVFSSSRVGLRTYFPLWSSSPITFTCESRARNKVRGIRGRGLEIQDLFKEGGRMIKGWCS